ncbi:putative carboxypeptidase C [Helianthus debilis subsp. tardiflorus]
MVKCHFIASFLVILFLPLVYRGSSATTTTAGTPDGSEIWGYIEVRPKAHMFWWYYKSPYAPQHPNNPWPLILWLPGGPGVPGGVVNFGGVGPLDFFLRPTNLTWLKKADLLFVDNPVGSGYSYVEDEELLAKTDEEVATDLITLLTEIFNKYQTLQKKPLYIVGWSYGAKFAATLGLLALKAIENNKLKLILGGIVLADGYISPEDYVVNSLDYNALKLEYTY